MTDRQQLNLRMPCDLYERLQANAAEDERSINGQVCFIVRQYLNGSRWATLEATNGETMCELQTEMKIRALDEFVALRGALQALVDEYEQIVFGGDVDLRDLNAAVAVAVGLLTGQEPT